MDFHTTFKMPFGFAFEKTPPKGFRKAMALFKEAARRVPAYKDFLQKNGIDPSRIFTPEDFAKLPRMDKPNYMSQYSLEERCWDGSLLHARYISTSSGSTGVPFFWPRGVAQDATTGHMFRNIYKNIFSVGEERVLFVNSFALGTWIAGFEFYNATKWVGDQDGRVTIVTPGIDKHEAVNQIRKLAPLFDRIVIGGYPPFVKDIIDGCEHAGIDVANLNLHLLVAGEAISIAWKQRMLERVGKPERYDTLVNIYGMAESGVVAHDTPLAQLLREHIPSLPDGRVVTHDGLPVTGVYQYYPELRYFEAMPGEALALTTDAGLPLIRYDTRDTGGILQHSIVNELPEPAVREAIRLGIDLDKWQQPFVYLNGRKDLSISLYALMIYVENIKYALENSSYAPMLSGLFTMSVEHTDNLDQQFTIKIELSGNAAPPELSGILQKEVVEKLCAVNSEYAKLLISVGDKAKPTIELLPHGHIHTMPGRKHKWVKRQ